MAINIIKGQWLQGAKASGKITNINKRSGRGKAQGKHFYDITVVYECKKEKNEKGEYVPVAGQQDIWHNIKCEFVLVAQDVARLDALRKGDEIAVIGEDKQEAEWEKEGVMQQGRKYISIVETYKDKDGGTLCLVKAKGLVEDVKGLKGEDWKQHQTAIQNLTAQVSWEDLGKREENGKFEYGQTYEQYKASQVEDSTPKTITSSTANNIDDLPF